MCNLHPVSHLSAASSFLGILMDLMLLREHLGTSWEKQESKPLYTQLVQMKACNISNILPTSQIRCTHSLFFPTQSVSQEGKTEKQFSLPTHKPLSILRAESSKGVDMNLTSGFNPDSNSRLRSENFHLQCWDQHFLELTLPFKAKL